MAASPSTHPHEPPSRRGRPPFRSLDELLFLGPDDLAHLYRTGETPRLSDLDGDLRGRLLAVPGAGRTVYFGLTTR